MTSRGRALRFAGAALGAALLAGVAAAAPPAGLLHDVKAGLVVVERALAARDLGGALTALTTATTAVRHDAPLAIPVVAVVDAPHSGLGHYRPVVDGAVAAGTLQLYVEVENLVPRPRTPAATSDGQGAFELAFDVAGDFYAKDGEAFEKLGRKDLGAQTLPLHRVDGVHSFGLTVALGKDVPAGDYAVDVEVTDAVSRKRALRRALFRVR